MERQDGEDRHWEARTALLLARGELIRAQAWSLKLRTFSRTLLSVAMFFAAAHFLPLR